MTRKNSFAVLLALFNGSEWVGEQVKSISCQRGVDLTLFVSDDGSSDGSVNVVSELAHQLNVSLHLVDKTISSGSAGQNFFYLFKNTNLLDYDYIALSDQDDIWEHDKLVSAISLMNKEKADAYSSNVMAFWTDGKAMLINKAQKQKKLDYMFESAGPGCTFVLTKELALELQTCLSKNEALLHNVMLHDWFIYAFARSKNYQWYIDPVPHLMYRQHDSNVVGANVGFSAKLSRWAKLREGWLLKQAIAIATVIGYEKSWPIKRLKRFNFMDKCVLAFNAPRFRRRFRDQVAFAVSLFFANKS